MSSRFADRVVLVTGATSGIGWEAALAFSNEGARVVGLGRDQGRLMALGEHIELALTCDLTKESDLQLAAEATLGRFGRVDVLVNNAGAGSFLPWDEQTLEHTRALFELNLFGAIALTRRVLPSMVEQGEGLVLNVASVAGLRGYPKHSAYCATKHALVGWSEALRLELGGTGVDVVTVCPPAVDTPFFDNAGNTTFREDHPGLTLMPAEEAAAGIVDAAFRRPPLVVLGRRAKLLYGLTRVAPGLLDALRRATGKIP